MVVLLHGSVTEVIGHVLDLRLDIHCVQKKTPTRSFFHISMNDMYMSFKQKSATMNI